MQAIFGRAKVIDFFVPLQRLSMFHQNSSVPFSGASRSKIVLPFRVLLLFPSDCQFSHNFLNLPLRPTTESVYKRSPSDGGQRYLVGLARSSPSNLRLAPSLHVLLIVFCTLHHPPSFNA